jgi:hydrogenase-4 component B
MSPGPLLLCAGFGLAIALAGGWRAPRVWLAGILLAALCAVGAATMVLSGVAEVEWEWRSAFAIGGDRLHLQLDALSALFLALLGVIGGVGALYARAYWPDATHPHSARVGRVAWSTLMLCMGLVLLSRHGLQFLIAWELFTVSAYFLITLERGRSEVRRAGWLYLGASHAASLSLFAFFAALAARLGTWEIGSWKEHTALAPLFWLALFGFGVKAGLFPLHIWLPSAHANAPSHVSAMMSGMTIKMGIYGLVRFSGWLPLPDGTGWVVAGLGVVSAVLGVAFALGQHDLKRLLAYHSVENIGIILIGLGFALLAVAGGNADWGRLALAGGLLHVWNHGLFKALLFLGAGSVLHATGTREMSRLGGLWRAMPWTAGLFALGAAAISGLPPLNGFVSEWLVYLGLFETAYAPGGAALAAVAAIVLLAMTGAMALACFAKVCGIVFLGAPRSPAAQHAHESGPMMRAPMLILAAACVAIGLAPAAFWPGIARAAASWNPAWLGLPPPPSLATIGRVHVALAVAGVLLVTFVWRWTARAGVARALTWDCGYAMPTARMQYTAGSFAGIITEWFAWILRPHREEERAEDAFPGRASHAQHTPETVLESVVVPASGLVLQVAHAARRLQHGRVQAYVFYLVAGLAALAAVALTGSPK